MMESGARPRSPPSSSPHRKNNPLPPPPRLKKTNGPHVERALQTQQHFQEEYGSDFVTLFARLVAYKKEHGDCLVPNSYKEDKELATWVKLQRQRNKANLMSVEETKQLETLAFTWSLPNRSSRSSGTAGWETMFERLLQYKKKHGDFLVPQRYKEDIALGTWCKNQRWKAKHNRIPGDQRRKLEEIGFPWEIAVQDRRRRGKASAASRPIIKRRRIDGVAKATTKVASQQAAASESMGAASWTSYSTTTSLADSRS